MGPEPELVVRWLKGVPSGRAAEQRVPFQREHWDGALTGDRRLTELYLPLADSFGGGIPREALYGLADDAQWEALHLWCLIWGYGSGGGLGNLKRSAVAEEVRTTDPNVLARICEAAQQSGRAGYHSLWDKINVPTIRGLRVSMGTKLIHFAGHGHATPEPLIFDERVWQSLAAAGLHFPHPTRGDVVTTEAYVRYVELVSTAADGLDCAPVDVECELFLRRGAV